ncbi:MAG: DUF5723 family protein [Owenweeksia sp.]|nr:DUF5723 family protein [Owenweeksia sp.]
MKNYHLIYSLILAMGALTTQAQHDLILYNFNAVPQSLHTNPGYAQQTRLWIGLPVISGIHIGYSNSAFTPGDIFAAGTDINQNVDNVLAGLDEKSQIGLQQDFELLGIGFRTGAGFWTMGVRQVMNFNTDVPGDLLRLAWYGNAPQDNRNVSLQAFDTELLHRLNTYVGWQNQYMDDRLSVGARFKYIIGLQHGYTEKTKASIVTQDNSSIVLDSDILYRTAGVASFIDGETPSFNNTILPQNSGFGIDLGGTFDLSEKWQISASVLDLGFINWRQNTRNYISQGRFEFNGLDADLSDDQPIKDFENILDSLYDAFEFREVDGESYTRSLAPRVFIGGNFRLNDKHSFGALYHARFWEDEIYNDFSVNYQGRLANAFQYTVNYSVINGTYANVGLGLMARLGPVQLYMMSDNVLGAVMLENLQTSNIRLGLNLAFYDKNKDKKKDKKSKQSPVQPATGESKSNTNKK